MRRCWICFVGDGGPRLAFTGDSLRLADSPGLASCVGVGFLGGVGVKRLWVWPGPDGTARAVGGGGARGGGVASSSSDLPMPNNLEISQYGAKEGKEVLLLVFVLFDYVHVNRFINCKCEYWCGKCFVE